VVKLTGVNDRTLRSWELKYSLIKPARSPGGHRLYSENDIKTILEVKAMIYEKGMSTLGVETMLAERRKK
jgi:DNA-binding transcriptional MerR regulator